MYVKGKGDVVERFLQFIPIFSHKGKSLADIVVKTLEEYGISVGDCRGQSYDNASNMSGQYEGVQAHVKRLNDLAEFVPCAAHSLNLVGKAAVESCEIAVNYFSLLQLIYNFFSSSTHRWHLLEEGINETKKTLETLKTLSGTRWSANSNAARFVRKYFATIKNVLASITEDPMENNETRQDAKNILQKLTTLETYFMSTLWDVILSRMDKTSQYLQSENMELGTAVNVLESLISYVSSLREKFAEMETSVKSESGLQKYSDEMKRKICRKEHFDESGTEEAVLLGSDKFRVETFFPIIDKLTSELQRRTAQYKNLHETFGFLTKFNSMNEEDITRAISDFILKYNGDVDSNFCEEFRHFLLYIQTLIANENAQNNSASSLTASKILLMLYESNLHTVFPNVCIAYRIYLSLFVTNCTGERSFSKLKWLKSPVRSNMTQQKLNALALLSIESCLVRELSFNDIIESFAEQKCRKKTFLTM